MNKTIIILEAIRDYEIEKYTTEKAFNEDLNELINEQYNGDISTFMNEEVLNEDYGDLRSELERIYNKECYYC